MISDDGGILEVRVLEKENKNKTKSLYRNLNPTKTPITLTYDLETTRDFFHTKVDFDTLILIYNLPHSETVFEKSKNLKMSFENRQNLT